MSTCDYFWGSFLRSVEIDPICPPDGAPQYWRASPDELFYAQDGEFVATVSASPVGEPGWDLLVSDGVTTSPQATPQWVDLGVLIPGVGFSIGLESAIGGSGEL